MANEDINAGASPSEKKGYTATIAKIVSLIFSILIIVYLFKITFDRSIIIHPFHIAKELTNTGYNDTTVAQLFLDDIKNINMSAKTIYKRKIFGLYRNEVDVNIPFIKEKISVSTAKNLIQRVFNVTGNNVNGDLRPVGHDSVEIVTRYNSEPALRVVGKSAN